MFKDLTKAIVEEKHNVKIERVGSNDQNKTAKILWSHPITLIIVQHISDMFRRMKLTSCFCITIEGQDKEGKGRKFDFIIQDCEGEPLSEQMQALQKENAKLKDEIEKLKCGMRGEGFASSGTEYGSTFVGGAR